jgi:hypothetical protein
MGEDDLASGGPISVDIDEQIAGLRDQAFGRLVEKRRKEKKLAMIEPKGSPRLDDPALAENHVLPALGERPTDGGPFLEGCLHEAAKRRGTDSTG